MADTQINIIINTIKKGFGDKDAKGALKELNGLFQQATGLSLGYAGALTAMIGITKKLVDVTKEDITQFSDYAQQVKDLSAVTGESAEQTSRLIQMADDAFVSYDSLTRAMNAAVRKGIDPSVESMAALSDSYLALQPGLERAKFLTDTFGRSGADMYKIMELGSATIEKNMGAISSSLVLNQKAIEIATEYKQAMDRLNDANDAFNIAVGKDATQSVSDFATVLAWAKEKTVEAYVAQEQGTKGYLATQRAAKEAGFGLHGLAEELRNAATATEDFSTRYDTFSGTFEMTTGAIVINTMAVLDNQDALGAGLKGAIEAATTAEGANYESIKKATAELINQRIMAGLTGDQAVEMAHKLGILSDADYAAALAADAINKGLQDGTIQMDDAAKMAEGLESNIAMLQDKHIQVTTDYVQNYINNYSGTQDAQKGSNGYTGYGHNSQDYLNQKGWGPMAAGGMFEKGDVLRVGEKGPETVVFPQSGAVIPNGGLGGINVVIQVNGAKDSKAVARDVVNELKRQMVRVGYQ